MWTGDETLVASNGTFTNGHILERNNKESLLGTTTMRQRRYENLTNCSVEQESSRSTSKDVTDSQDHSPPAQDMQNNFQELVHDNDLCKEYVIKRGRTNILLWISFFIVFHVGALEYYFELYTKDKRILFGFIGGLLCLCGWTLNRKVIEESLLVVSSLGVQITTKFASGRQTSIFFDKTEIKDIIIQESITMQCVVYILSILLKKPDMDGYQLLPLFKHSFPRLDFLRRAYQGVQSVMSFNTKSVDGR